MLVLQLLQPMGYEHYMYNVRHGWYIIHKVIIANNKCDNIAMTTFLILLNINY